MEIFYLLFQYNKLFHHIISNLILSEAQINVSDTSFFKKNNEIYFYILDIKNFINYIINNIKY